MAKTPRGRGKAKAAPGRPAARNRGSQSIKRIGKQLGINRVSINGLALAGAPVSKPLDQEGNACHVAAPLTALAAIPEIASACAQNKNFFAEARKNLADPSEELTHATIAGIAVFLIGEIVSDAAEPKTVSGAGDLASRIYVNDSGQHDATDPTTRTRSRSARRRPLSPRRSPRPLLRRTTSSNSRSLRRLISGPPRIIAWCGARLSSTVARWRKGIFGVP